MILNFAIKNYKSINELMNIEFEVDASIKTNNHHNLIIEKNNIKSSRLNFLYGNNGSGKSNIINGIKVLKMIALNELEKINAEQLIIPFKLSTKTNDDIFFHLDFISNNNRYNYNVYYDSKKQELRDEELVLVNGEVETIIFDRQIGKGKFAGIRCGIKAFSENYEGAEFEILTETCGGYSTTLEGLIWKDECEPVSGIITIWTMGDIVFEFEKQNY